MSDRDAAMQALGWLKAAIEADHPGFIADQANRAGRFAEKHSDDSSLAEVAAVLADWANRAAEGAS